MFQQVWGPTYLVPLSFWYFTYKEEQDSFWIILLAIITAFDGSTQVFATSKITGTQWSCSISFENHPFDIVEGTDQYSGDYSFYK